ncbi:MAG: hypothetical protein ACE141_18075 [Bryobacteraceae bacterium]
MVSQASEVLQSAAKEKVQQHLGALANSKGTALSALGVLAWKAGALFAEANMRWKIDYEVFEQAYGWSPGTKTSDGEYYDEEFDALPREEQDRREAEALLGKRVQDLGKSLPRKLLGEDGSCPFETIGEMMNALNDESRWPFERIAELLRRAQL